MASAAGDATAMSQHKHFVIRPWVAGVKKMPSPTQIYNDMHKFSLLLPPDCNACIIYIVFVSFFFFVKTMLKYCATEKA